MVGITGSNGKTTVKEMTGSILGCEGPTLVTRGNLNNHIGVPLTLCRLEAAHRFAVIEMGANHLHEIAQLAAIGRPDVGLVTNAGPAHLEGFGGIEGVARGKGEMFQALGPGGTAVINADDRYAALWRDLARDAGRVLTFGLREEADFTARDLRSNATADGFVTEFELVAPSGRRGVTLALAGEHNVRNALAAAAAAYGAGAGLDAIVEGLGRMRAVAGRLEAKQLPGGARLIDDSYNANPGSVRAGLRALAGLPAAALAGARRDARARCGIVGAARRGRRLRPAVRHRAPAGGRRRRPARGRVVRRRLDVVRERRGADRGVARRVAGGRHRAGQGLAREPPRASRSGTRRRRRRRRPLTCCATSREWLAQYYSGFNVFSYLTLRAILAALTALVISFLVGPAMIRKLAEHQIGQRVRTDGPQTHLQQGRHADHGRPADPGGDRRGDAAVGRPRQPLRVDHARGHGGVRPDRLLGRLPEAGGRQLARA